MDIKKFPVVLIFFIMLVLTSSYIAYSGDLISFDIIGVKTLSSTDYDRNNIELNRIPVCEVTKYNNTFVNYTWCNGELSKNGTYDKYVCGNETIITEYNETTCKDSGKFNVIISFDKYTKAYTYICDDSKFGKCGLTSDKKSICCDSNKDGNGDGVCQGGESIIKLFEDKKETLGIATEINRKISTFPGLDTINGGVECVRI